MERNKKLRKLCGEFITLNEPDREYVLGVAQALSFAAQNASQTVPVKWEFTGQPITEDFVRTVYRIK
jgi:hypothetical protein